MERIYKCGIFLFIVVALIVQGCTNVKKETVKKYYDNGYLKEQYEIINGKKEGKYKSYFRNGRIHLVGIYHNDHEIGRWVINWEDSTKSIYNYDSTGQKKTIEDYNSLNKKIRCIGFPYTPQKVDTIFLGRNYIATYGFRFPLKSKVDILVGKFNLDKSKLDTIYQRLESPEYKYIYKEQPKTTGLHRVDCVILQYEKEKDTIIVDGLGFVDYYYVKDTLLNRNK